jgi:hypothetical protein
MILVRFSVLAPLLPCIKATKTNKNFLKFTLLHRVRKLKLRLAHISISTSENKTPKIYIIVREKLIGWCRFSQVLICHLHRIHDSMIYF